VAWLAAVSHAPGQTNSPTEGLLLARVMGQYCFARWRLSSSSVTLPAGSRADRPQGARAADTPWQASRGTSR